MAGRKGARGGGWKAAAAATSIEIDARIGDIGRDAGSILFEFFRTRLVQCSARRIGNLEGPRPTAEGYVMLAWLAHR